MGTTLRNLGHPLIEWGAARAYELIDCAQDAEQQLTLAHFVMFYFLMTGQRWHQGAQLLKRMDDVLEKTSVSPMQSLQWSALKITWYAICSATCSQSRGREEIERFIALSQSSGIRVLDVYGLGQGIYFALIWRDVELASQLLERMRTSVAPHRTMDVSHFYWLQAAVALERGELSAASDDLNVAIEKANAGGAGFGMAPVRLLSAQLCFMQGHPEQAVDVAEQVITAARAASSLTFEHAGLMIKAYALLESNQEQEIREQLGVETLREGLLLGKNTGQSVIAPFALARITSYLYSEALNRDIEVEYVCSLIKTYGVPPINTDVPHWPWPIKIYTLGRFSVVLDGRPLEFSGRVQRRPLELLQIIVAFGARDISCNAVIDALWPDAEADAAQDAMAKALRRLRSMLGEHDVVSLQDNKLSLNTNVVWIDKLELERALGQPLEVIDGEKVAALYKGEFLTKETDASWMLGARERLRNRVLTTLLRKGKLLMRAHHYQQAIALFERGVDIDALAEEFYCNLMRCHLALEQSAEGLAVYRHCKNQLSAVLRVSPSPETESVERALRKASG